MELALAYHHQSAVTSSPEGSALDFAANLRRAPVSFRGRVREPVLLRQLMLALHEVILNDSRWLSDEEYWATLDPVITVHPDQLFFEAFSSDESSYARLSADFEAFEPEGTVQYGTTNIDFTWGLRDALQTLRSSRRTLFAVGAGGFGVTTVGLPGGTRVHFERKVDLPESWVKGFLQVQGALAMPAFTFDVRPADLLTMIAFFQENKPPRAGAHSLRYEMRPGQPITIAVEPWMERFPLKGTLYEGYERTVRVWGRRRLELLRGVLPYAQKVTVGLLGRGLPHYYICHCGAYKFVLLLSGWTRNDWASGSALELLAPQLSLTEEVIDTVHRFLTHHLLATRTQIAAETGLEKKQVEAALFHLCRTGRVIWDPTTRMVRLRELFGEAPDSALLFPPNPRIQQAQTLVDAGAVELTEITLPAQNTRPETRALAQVRDGATYQVTVAVDEDQHLRFGRCGCPFFQENLMSRGPCEHILAARLALQEQAQAESA